VALHYLPVILIPHVSNLLLQQQQHHYKTYLYLSTYIYYVDLNRMQCICQKFYIALINDIHRMRYELQAQGYTTPEVRVIKKDRSSRKGKSKQPNKESPMVTSSNQSKEYARKLTYRCPMGVATETMNTIQM
jgi:hypothetical protein